MADVGGGRDIGVSGYKKAVTAQQERNNVGCNKPVLSLSKGVAHCTGCLVVQCGAMPVGFCALRGPRDFQRSGSAFTIFTIGKEIENEL
jgi:hypothetical protein